MRAWTLALAAVLGSAAATTLRADDPPRPPAPATLPPSVVSGYVGSDACAPCHEKEYREWKASLHSRMEQPATAATVLGAFTPDGTVVKAEAEGKRIVMQRVGDEYWIEAPDSHGVAQRYRIERTIGNRYKQRYLTRLASGAYHVLPVQWFEKDGRFVEWHHKASVPPGGGDFWLDPGWAWQIKCAGCHTTGLDLGHDATKGTWDTRFQELAIGCEACHGPGLGHVRAGRGTDNILCPSAFEPDRQVDVCGKCHSRGTAGPEQGVPAGLPTRLAYPYNMVPGGRLDDAYVQATPTARPAEFWGDGSSRNHHQQWNDHRTSGMYRHGGDKAPHCTTCHDPHRAADLKASVEDNALCVACHEPLADPKALARHTGHGADPRANPGARCVECHMPRIVDHAGTFKLRSHVYDMRSPRRAAETKTPDACLLCHKDRDATWSVDAYATLWPEAEDQPARGDAAR